MTVPSVHCEVKKIAYRQSKDGIIISFCVHPSDVPDTLALAPLGQRYMLALAAIGDDELPVEPPSLPPAERPGVETGSSPTARARASQFAKGRYQEAPPTVQAVTRSVMLAKDERFRAWLPTIDGIGLDKDYTEEEAAQYIRAMCCEDQTRAIIADDPEAYRKFLALETMFRLAVGELPEIRS